VSLGIGEAPHLFPGKATAGACLLLNMVRDFSTTTASRVTLVMPFSETGGTLGLQDTTVKGKCEF